MPDTLSRNQRFESPIGVEIEEWTPRKQHRGLLEVVTRFQRRKSVHDRHVIILYVSNAWRSRLSQFHSTPVCVPCLLREDNNFPFLIEISVQRPVLLFVERHELNAFIDLVQDKPNVFIISLPHQWKRRGCRVVRQIIKSVVETLYFEISRSIFENYFLLDDDIVGGVVQTDQKIFSPSSLEDIFRRLIDFQNRKEPKPPIVCVQPPRNRRFAARHWVQCKDVSTTKRAEKLVLVNTALTLDVHYCPPFTFDTVSKLTEDEIRQYPHVFMALRQGEDFGLCFQLPRDRQALMLRRIFLLGWNLPSRNGTKKSSPKDTHQIMAKLNEKLKELCKSGNIDRQCLMDTIKIVQNEFDSRGH